MGQDTEKLLGRALKKVRKRLLGRSALSLAYLRGHGLEIGAFQNPLRVPPWAKVTYVDRMSTADLGRHFAGQLGRKRLVPVGIVDDGERLASVGQSSQDFVIASHVIEHCQDPLSAAENWLRVLKPGGVLFLVIPDKRNTFDRDRPVTPLEHLLRDRREGPEWSRRGHYEELVRLANKVTEETEAAREVERLMAAGDAIHFHVWTQREMLEMLLHVQGAVPFDIEAMVRSRDGFEVIFVIRKGGAA